MITALFAPQIYLGMDTKFHIENRTLRIWPPQPHLIDSLLWYLANPQTPYEMIHLTAPASLHKRLSVAGTCQISDAPWPVKMMAY
jgi:hypothetical protein